MKSILSAILFALFLSVAGSANATVSLLPGAVWCPTTAFTLAHNQAAIYTTFGYDNSVVGSCQILSIGIHNYGIPDLGAYGLNGPDYIKSVSQAIDVQGSYRSDINYGGGTGFLNYGSQTYATNLNWGWFPASVTYHRRSGT